MSLLSALFSFKGRLRRSEFWLFSSMVFAAMMTAAGITGELTGIDVADAANPRGLMIQLAAVVLFMWPNLAVCAKRLHDRGLSGWWVLLSFLPIIGNVWMLITLGVMRGDNQANRYGAQPARDQLTLIPRTFASA
jgi:uncharacterized membrane protein YhaH (DUF805 family)